MSATGKWIKVSESLPKPWDKVLARFVDKGIRYHFIAWIDPSEEWNLYYLYTSYPLNKKILIPTHWAEIIEVEKDNIDD